MILEQAWLAQAASDLKASEVLLRERNESLHCQCVAKYQQAVEKSVKGLATAVNRLGKIQVSVGYSHPVERIASTLLKSAWDFPQGLNSGLQVTFSRYYGDIRALDEFAPRRPPPGQPHQRNTEYPFEDGAGNWTHPAAAGRFTQQEVDRFRKVATDVNMKCNQLVFAVDVILRSTRLS